MISPLQPGTKLEVVIPFYTLAGKDYTPGMILELVEPTTKFPHGFKSPLGNWIVKCPHMTSVWSSIWLGVEQGVLKVS
jgi:hypothetical protein